VKSAIWGFKRGETDSGFEERGKTPNPKDDTIRSITQVSEVWEEGKTNPAGPERKGTRSRPWGKNEGGRGGNC